MFYFITYPSNKMENKVISDLLFMLLAFITLIAAKKDNGNSFVDVHLTSVKRERFSKRNTDCVPLEFDELMSQYKAWSGYNSQYIAATAEDAVLFPNLLWSNEDKADYMFIINQLSNLYKRVLDPNDPNSALKFKNLIESSLNLSISTHSGVTTGNNKRITDGITTIKVCTGANSENPKTKLVNMCNQCTTTTTQSENWFPRYINEVICVGNDRTVVKDPKCFGNEGVCQQNKIIMNFLVKTDDCVPLTVNGNTVYVEKWEKTQKFIRTSCECLLLRNSPYRKYLY